MGKTTVLNVNQYLKHFELPYCWWGGCLSGVTPRGVQNVSNMDSHLALWVFPLFSTIINSTKNFRHLAYQEHPSLAIPFRTQKYKGFSKGGRDLGKSLYI